MGPDIYMMNSGGAGKANALENLHFFWANLDMLVRHAPSSPRRSGREARTIIIKVAKACPSCRYGLFSKFELRGQRWVWTELSFPGD
jgi:hypothetical protein